MVNITSGHEKVSAHASQSESLPVVFINSINIQCSKIGLYKKNQSRRRIGHSHSFGKIPIGKYHFANLRSCRKIIKVITNMFLFHFTSFKDWNLIWCSRWKEIWSSKERTRASAWWNQQGNWKLVITLSKPFFTSRIYCYIYIA